MYVAQSCKVVVIAVYAVKVSIDSSQQIYSALGVSCCKNETCTSYMLKDVLHTNFHRPKMVYRFTGFKAQEREHSLSYLMVCVSSSYVNPLRYYDRRIGHLESLASVTLLDAHFHYDMSNQVTLSGQLAEYHSHRPYLNKIETKTHCQKVNTHGGMVIKSRDSLV